MATTMTPIERTKGDLCSCGLDAARDRPHTLRTEAALRDALTAFRAALTAFGHHADGCEYAMTVCTCGFTAAMRTLVLS